MVRLPLLLAAVLLFAACDSHEAEFPSRGRFDATLRGTLDLDLEGDATVTRLSGSDAAVFHSVALTSRGRDGSFGRSVSVSGVIAGPGSYDLDESRFDAVSVIYFDEVRDVNGIWSAVSGTLVVTRNDADRLEGSVDAVLERTDFQTGVSGGRVTLEADFEAVTPTFLSR